MSIKLNDKLLKVNIENIPDNINTPCHFINTNIQKQLKYCIELYTSNNCISSYYHFFKNYVACEFDNLNDKIGIDYGSRFSVSSSIFSLFNNKKIYAVDFYNKEIVDALNKQIDSNIEYYDIDNIDKISHVDWIMIYDVLDSYISDIPIEIDFSNRLEYLRNLLNNDGILVLTTYESTTKIKLHNLEKIIAKYFMDYKIYYNNDDGRFVITCYRNISNASSSVKF
tara:strand:- start:351 stop:1025 length:675 start_codon:yes stop_codon:yes gene_type:complete